MGRFPTPAVAERSTAESPVADLINRIIALLAANFHLFGRMGESYLTYSYYGGFSRRTSRGTGEKMKFTLFFP
jgi:hypothetical protein